jgi:hypothetical protein
MGEKCSKYVSFVTPAATNVFYGGTFRGLLYQTATGTEDVCFYFGTIRPARECPMSDFDDSNVAVSSLRRWDAIRDRLLEGTLIPFLGAGASSFSGTDHPPSGKALLEALAEKCQVPRHCVPGCGDIALYCNENCLRPGYDLARIASYYQLVQESRPTLDRELTSWIGRNEFRPNVLHRLLARVARVKPLLIVTTNYDDLLERAFDDLAVREPDLGPISYEVIATAADLLAYRDTTGEGGGNSLPDDQGTAFLSGRSGVLYRRLGGQPGQCGDEVFTEIYPAALSFDLSKRSVIYKVHGSVPRGPNWDGGYLIAEEDYVRFLGKMDRPDIYPHAIKNIIRSKTARRTGRRRIQSNALFLLGYSMGDWNLRVLMDELGIGYGELGSERHYGVFRKLDRISAELLRKRNFTPFDIDLNECIAQLSECLEERLGQLERDRLDMLSDVPNGGLTATLTLSPEERTSSLAS